MINNNKINLDPYIDFIIVSYIDNTFGVPSSLENFTRFITAIEKYEKLIKNNLFRDELNDKTIYKAFI